ncbi:hypothetical protein PR048_002276 [Dryococelus australis]|uniref:Uncharacterized protein n=1 Tax=Dryococelus australis TaxID=614101 RepID=A0ABQ9IJQ4_9NEOP|nr:hypothetical protein PR048_002276 [Dryococelus australis]
MPRYPYSLPSPPQETYTQRNLYDQRTLFIMPEPPLHNNVRTGAKTKIQSRASSNRPLWLSGYPARLPPMRSGFNPRADHSGFLHVGIVPDDAIGRRFSWGSPVSPAPSFRCCSILISITLIGSQDLSVKSCPNFFTHPREASSGMIPTCKNPGVTRPGMEPGLPWWEASRGVNNLHLHRLLFSSKPVGDEEYASTPCWLLGNWPPTLPTITLRNCGQPQNRGFAPPRLQPARMMRSTVPWRWRAPRSHRLTPLNERMSPAAKPEWYRGTLNLRLCWMPSHSPSRRRAPIIVPKCLVAPSWPLPGMKTQHLPAMREENNLYAPVTAVTSLAARVHRPGLREGVAPAYPLGMCHTQLLPVVQHD